jgi:Ca2+-binding EF-hand superfamily protein
MEDIGRKLPLKFNKPRDAFRCLDVERDGQITPSEMRSFLRGFGWGEDVADRLFALLDEEERGEVDYNMFMAHFAPVLGPALFPATRSRLLQPPLAGKLEPRLGSPTSSCTGTVSVLGSVIAPSGSGAPSNISTCLSEEKDIDRQLNAVAKILGEKMRTKFRNGREALRSLNLRNEGQITRSEMRTFFRHMCLPIHDADAFFDGLKPECAGTAVGEGTVRYDDLVALLCPPNGNTATKPLHWRAMEDLREAPMPGEGLTVYRRLSRADVHYR